MPSAAAISQLSRGDIAARVTSYATTQSPIPASFDGDTLRYGTALHSLMCLGIFSLMLACWMARDIWRDRFNDHPFTLTFTFRFIFMLIGTIGFVRAMPEVVYMTCYGEVTGHTMATILSVKRYADTLALPIFMTWITCFIVAYPQNILNLRSYKAVTTPSLDFIGVWPRLIRAGLIFVTVATISAMIAAAKGSMGH